MGWHDRIAGILSPITSHNDHSHIANHYENKNTYNQNVHYQVNSTQTKILSISGSNNHGTMLNNPQFNMTTLIDRPVLLQFNQQPLLIYAIAAVIFILKLFLFLACFYRHQNKRDARRYYRRRRRRRRSSSIKKPEQTIDESIEVPMAEEQSYDILTESTTQWAHDKIMQYMDF